MRLIDADTLIKELEEEAKSLEKESFEIKENTVLKSNLRGRADGIRDALIEIIDAPTVEPSMRIGNLPSAQPEDWIERNKARILQAGMEGREIEFRIGGRLFAIREKAQ